MNTNYPRHNYIIMLTAERNIDLNKFDDFWPTWSISTKYKFRLLSKYKAYPWQIIIDLGTKCETTAIFNFIFENYFNFRIFEQVTSECRPQAKLNRHQSEQATAFLQYHIGTRRQQFLHVYFAYDYVLPHRLWNGTLHASAIAAVTETHLLTMFFPEHMSALY